MKLKPLAARRLDYFFYDVTNYYAEKDFLDPDESYRNRNNNIVNDLALRQKGVSKGQ